MAGDWIKWGKGFLRKPEIVGMMNALGVSRETVACGYMRIAEWLDSEGQPDNPDDIDSDITIQILSRKARDTSDALLSHLDEVAGVPGLGGALVQVHWVMLSRGAIIFKRAARHNTETAKTRALASKRQRRKRGREGKKPSRKKRDDRHACRVTREEKRRGSSCTDVQEQGAHAFDALEVALPPCLAVPNFRAAWADWCQHRREIRKKLTPLAVTKALNALEAMGPERAVAAIQHSIAKGWTGIYEVGEGKRRDARFHESDGPNPNVSIEL